MMNSDNLFWRRLHSFTGAVPLGAYLLFHLYENSYSLMGQAAYDTHVRPLRNLPYLVFIESAVIFIPLAYHALYGFYIVYTGRQNPVQFPYARNWLYTMQRVTGVIIFPFVLFHLYDQRFRPDVAFANVSGSIAHPVVLWVYIIGITAAAWHLLNGLWNVFIKWGFTIGAKSQSAFLAACSILGIGLVVVGLRALVGFMK
jgi:succinate dehydrogenase / fumarate reductase cytochrome b subunit